jgi:hypothetical protein
MRPKLRSFWSICLLAGCLVALSVNSLHATGIDAALVPDASAIAFGTVFEVRIHVTNPGVEFNTYETYISYDPSILTFLQASPVSLQEGSYMTTACGNTFHVFQAQPTTLHITHSIMCLNQYLVTEGDAYILRFRANDVAGVAQIVFDQIRFQRGVYVASLGTTTNASVQISAPTDATTPSADRVQLRVAPNPFNPTTTLAVESPVSGFQRVVVRDLRGRVIDVLQAGDYPAGPRRLVWSGIGPDGHRLASGCYVVTLETPAGSISQRAILVK